ncbi:hypothetical protein [Roseococcus sp.]|uniref:hypothetical protein n=1 Tax=Roseococcus sp. TaxID=2109646 RepID=UPI003BA8A86C
MLRPLSRPQIHDFAVIWDEDHDERVLEAVEQIYLAGLLAPVLFIGEKKGNLTLVLDLKFFQLPSAKVEQYEVDILQISENLPDSWPAFVGSFDRNLRKPISELSASIIADTDDRVEIYLRSIDSLWGLGQHNRAPRRFTWPGHAP